MESPADMELQNIRNELTQGRELVKQLQLHLNAPSSSQEVCGFLINKIIESYDQALTMVKYNGHLGEGETTTAPVSAAGMPESPQALAVASPTTQDWDMELLDHDPNSGPRNRKDTPRWTKQVQVNYPAQIAPEGPLYDGYSWRKYGQKDILGAIYPRDYYRCTHRYTQGCLATKQVQRSDDDPTIVEVTYRGTHTCSQDISSKLPSALTPDQNQEYNFNVGGDHHMLSEPQPDQQAQCSNFQREQKIMITEDHSDTTAHSFTYSFSFPSPSSLNQQPYAFSPGMINNNFLDNFHPPTLPPIVAGLNHSELAAGIASATTSATNSPGVGIDLPFISMGFGSNSNSENPGSFS